MMTGKEALIALANGEEVECRAYEKNWINANNKHHPLGLFFDDSFQFRLKPRTITINGIEVPAHFEPKKGDMYYRVNPTCLKGDYYKIHSFSDDHFDRSCVEFGVWRTESEIQQVVAALRSIFK